MLCGDEHSSLFLRFSGDGVKKFDNVDARSSLTSSSVETSLKNERTVSSSSVSENDLDYESVSSPGNSSTASGPTYIRPAGFDHHAHDVLAPLVPPTSASTKKLSTR